MTPFLTFQHGIDSHISIYGYTLSLLLRNSYIQFYRPAAVCFLLSLDLKIAARLIRILIRGHQIRYIFTSLFKVDLSL